MVLLQALLAVALVDAAPPRNHLMDNRTYCD